MTQFSTPKATPPLEAIEPREVVASLAATESTAATVATKVAEQTPESATSVTVAKVGEETFGLPTRKMKPTKVARGGSNQVVNPATKLQIELAYSAV